MEATIMNKDFVNLADIDSFSSFIWTDRYREAGDFVLDIPIRDASQFTYVKPDYYLYNSKSEHVMIIQGFLVNTDLETGNMIKITGESLECILKRRIIWDPTTITGNLQQGVQKLLNDAIIAPKEPQRKIDNFVFKASTDTRITSLTMDAVYEDRENLYDVIVALCEDKDIGWKVILNSKHQFEFSLYKGTDHTFAQQLNPWVIFSPNFEDILRTEYLVNNEDYRNVCLVNGEDTDNQVEDKDPPMLWTVVGHHVGLDRYETYSYAGSLVSDKEDANGDPIKLTPAEKQKMMEQSGSELLAEHKAIKAFTGEVDPRSGFQYGRDYTIGDRVQIENDFSIEGTSTVSEFIMCHDASGYTEYPTFTEFEQEEKK